MVNEHLRTGEILALWHNPGTVHMIGAALLLVMAMIGLHLVGFLAPNVRGYAPPMVILGWAMILFPLMRWRMILKGLRGWGKLVVFLLVVAVLAALINGQPGLWNRFF